MKSAMRLGLVMLFVLFATLSDALATGKLQRSELVTPTICASRGQFACGSDACCGELSVLPDIRCVCH